MVSTKTKVRTEVRNARGEASTAMEHNLLEAPESTC